MPRGAKGTGGSRRARSSRPDATTRPGVTKQETCRLPNDECFQGAERSPRSPDRTQCKVSRHRRRGVGGRALFDRAARRRHRPMAVGGRRARRPQPSRYRGPTSAPCRKPPGFKRLIALPGLRSVGGGGRRRGGAALAASQAPCGAGRNPLHIAGARRPSNYLTLRRRRPRSPTDWKQRRIEATGVWGRVLAAIRCRNSSHLAPARVTDDGVRLGESGPGSAATARSPPSGGSCGGGSRSPSCR